MRLTTGRISSSVPGGSSSGQIRNDKAFEIGSSSSLTASALRYYLDTPNDLMDGGIAVFAAGNESGAMSGYPGAYKECISVTSIAADGLPAYYTNYISGCNIIAPGGEYCTGGVGMDHSECLILSTMPTVELPDVTGRQTARDQEYYHLWLYAGDFHGMSACFRYRGSGPVVYEAAGNPYDP